MAIEFSSSTELVSVDLGGADVVISNGTVRMVQCTGVGEITINSASLEAVDLTCGLITLNSGTGASIEASKLTCGGLDLNGGSAFQNVFIDGLRMGLGQLDVDGDFDEFSITGAVLGRANSSGASISIVDINGLSSFKLEGIIYRSAQHGALFTNCVAGDIDLSVIDPGSATDNTYDGINLAGVCDRLTIRGDVRGAVNQANNPRYGLNIAAGCLDIQVDLEVTGAQTGAFNNLAGLEVWFHPHVSLETPAEDDVLVWDDTNKIWRPEPGAGVGGGVDEVAELIDVDLTGLANGDVLIWDSAAGMWEPAAPAGGGGGQVMAEDEDPVHADGDTFPGSSLDGSWTEFKTSGSDPSEVNRGAYWSGTIAESGASSLRSVGIYKTVTLAVGDTLIACVEQYTLGDNESLVGVQMMAAASGDAAGLELIQSATEVAQIRYYSVASGVKTSVYAGVALSYAGRFWLGVKHTATNQYQPWASLNGTLWVPVSAATSITLTPARILFQSGSNNVGGPTLGALHLIDVVTTI